MEHCFSNPKWLILLHFLHWFHLLWMTSASSGSQSDGLALLDFKHKITQDPLQIMSSWKSSVHFCNWTGVTCGPTNGRVIFLNLESQHLVGSLPPSIGNLTSLTGINLQNNSFHGEVPQEIGRLQHLQQLNLSNNYFGGIIPSNLSRCKELRAFEAYYNEFTGLPDQLSSLSKLETLHLDNNNLTGSIPASIGNLTSLQTLSVAINYLRGKIPKELGLMPRLEILQLSGNYLSGTIPSSVFNISSIWGLAMTQNQLHGQLPSDLGLTLPNLQYLLASDNNFAGSIPISLPNASYLQFVYLSENGLTGTVPESFGSLQYLVGISFEDNRLGDGDNDGLNFLTFLANCTMLEVLGLAGNLFGGELPNTIGNLSTQLQMITLGSNQIHGKIPIGVGNLINLTALGLEKNYLSGSLPDVIGRLRNLQALQLHANKLSGSIPSSIGNLTELTELYMQDNEFEGSVPQSLGNCQRLQTLNLSGNNLNGTIPKQVISLSSLSVSLDMSNNFLTGLLPQEVGNMKSLTTLALSENKLSGQIPSSLDTCTNLEHLYLRRNMFNGTIPQSLKNLVGLKELDLSYNNLSGQIPIFFTNLSSLKYLNLSYNKLDGEVPKEGIFANASIFSLVGNGKLCGGIPELLLPMCSRKVPRKNLSSKVVISVSIAIILVIILGSSLAVYYMVSSSRKRSMTTSAQQGLNLSYLEISRSTNNFSEENLIGLGSFGSVYKGTLPGNGQIVAVKVLKVQQQRALKSFIDECNILRSTRHRNILKVITVCSSVDHEDNDFKCLVFEFMSNGSLDKWLHATAEEHPQIKKLSMMQRLNIAIDVASAFDYLHHHCETPIVHCDLKPSNVLLDEDMTAHVGDFGLARFLFEELDNPSQNQTISVALRGSIGYIPPEYMGGQVSILGDIYSYGILLLEMFTGKRPTDAVFKDDLNIHKFVLMAFPNHVIDIVDPSLLFEEQNDDDRVEEAMTKNIESEVNYKRKKEECLVSVLRIGLMCSATSPTERMAMTDVVNNLKKIRDSFLKSKVRNRGRRR